MKQYFTILFIMLSMAARSQQDTAHNMQPWHPLYAYHSIQATIALGFFDTYRNDFTVPPGFEKNNTSGYANVSAKVDYALARHISLAANFGYDAFIYNYDQLYQGNNGLIKRYKANTFRAFYEGLIAYYHLGNLITVKRLDPFVGVGLTLTNLRYGVYPQGDSTVVKLDHTITPYIKVGAHYYISDKFSLFADLGYEKQSIFSFGCSCRFFAKNHRNQKSE